MHTIKLKHALIITLIFLFYGIWLSHGKAEKVSITKDLEQVPAHNEKETRSIVETGILSLEKSLQASAEENLQRSLPDTVRSEISLNDNERNTYLRTFPQIPFNTYSIISEQLRLHVGKEIQACDTEAIYHQTAIKKEDSTTTVITEGKDTQKELSIDKDNQTIVTDEETSSATSPSTLSNPSHDEEISLIETEKKEEINSTWKIWHSEPTHSVILAVVITLAAAKVGGWIARMVRLPGVVGKLILGMILGNIYLVTGSDYFDFLKTMPFIKMISYFGTLILLLTAGLHTDLRALLRVGASSFLVCLGGIVAPAVLGIIASYFLLPDASNGTKLLLAIVLGNTSTGLLFAILNELKAMSTLEGRIIVGATILSEIIVILTFGIASGIVVKGGVSLLGISVSFGIALLFLITAILIIFKYGEKFGNFLTKKLTERLNIPIIVILSLLLAFMFGSIGLHTVIGAFIAGLFLRNVKLKDSDDREHRTVESFIRPFYAILVPILFVRVGALVDLRSFFNIDAILLGIAITGAAVAGKLFCSVCPIEKGIKRLAIGIGMATKLEGTLILTGIGRDIRIFNDMVFSSIIMVIVFTSMVCPFLMRILLLRKKSNFYEDIYIAPEKIRN